MGGTVVALTDDVRANFFMETAAGRMNSLAVADAYSILLSHLHVINSCVRATQTDRANTGIRRYEHGGTPLWRFLQTLRLNYIAKAKDCEIIRTVYVRKVYSP